MVPGVQEAAWNALDYTEQARVDHADQSFDEEWEAQPLDHRCRFDYPACAPTCVNQFVARNSTIYKFPNKGCYVTLGNCKVYKCFVTPQLYSMDVQRVDCPHTVCEFAAGLHR